MHTYSDERETWLLDNGYIDTKGNVICPLPSVFVEQY